MDNVFCICDHPRYTPKRVLAFVYFLLDKRLNEMAIEIYRFLLSKCGEVNGRLYCKFGSVEDLREAFMQFEANDLKRKMSSHADVGTGVTLLRKFQYIKFTYDHDMQAKVVLLPKYVGELA